MLKVFKKIMEKPITNRPRLRNIEDTLVLLESEEGPDGEKINWKDLYEKVGPWESGLELADKVREVVRGYLVSKFPEIKERIPSINALPDKEVLDALSNSWFEGLEEKVKGKRSEVLLSVLTHILRRIEKRIYTKIIENSSDDDLEKLGLSSNLRTLVTTTLEASVKSDPLYIRYLAYAQLSPKPPEDANPSAPIGQDGKPHTWAELFPHETQFISKKLKNLLKSKEKWQDVEGAGEFIKYIELLADYFSEKDVNKAREMKDEIEMAYADSITGGFPVIISPPTGSYYKEPYLDPELRVSLRTPESRAQEQNFIALQNVIADELGTLGVSQFADDMRQKPIASVVSIGAYGANLTFTAAAETEKDITLFLDEQIRRYDKNLKDFLPMIEISDNAFGDTPVERIEEMSREDTIFHELSHSIWTLDKEAQKRLGIKSETIIGEIAAETISRGLAKELIEKGKINYTQEQYIAVTIAIPLQVIKGRDPNNEYFKAAVYVLNGMFEQGLIEFSGTKIRVKKIDEIFDYLQDNAKKIIALYEDSEMNGEKANKWVKENTTAGKKLQELIDFIKK
ncbi:MAG: hypothetical protein A3B86_03325 [Candidatus Yanofskybacteria bacterium RIFCSPHIGHO2_02_FULL_38_22b]|uniref:Uncharacterized protein n=1 Tax=Candidatus Yanofskybacteria bacterium RIFCSPHIGHO2_02_FULL_38_22b TaxID=1802673 RepID=A0A1F8F1D6_9BACT|nr:MAG: hypothetical protein A3B86_03325 [Candidatus Yanofskybacteria bacterium RIFCSPHIGHO2_02_FULL_38_22b]OGN19879.1 MAG: hypothetical protein A2910_01900 [Candidatus Yanofskybacteria bacterium RIFCSPLOWO2_01_FULL_39_28]